MNDETTHIPMRNLLLAHLPQDELLRLCPLLTSIALVPGQVLYESGDPIRDVYFLQSGLVSTFALAHEGQWRLEVGLKGRDTMCGLGTLLGPNTRSFSCVSAQTSSLCYRMPSDALRSFVTTAPVLNDVLHRALEMSVAQSEQAAICCSRHALSERLARWLLMAHDRIDGDQLHLTQDSLALILAVWRPSVTIALNSLETGGAIKTSRGRIDVVSRARLEASTCPCYGRLLDFEVTVFAPWLHGRKYSAIP